MPTFHLVMRRGPKAGEKFELKTQTVIIGRDSSADISINDPEVSRNHCRFILDKSYYIQDLGSTNGTFVDGQRLGGEPTKLQSGQIVQLGSNVTLLYQETQTSSVVFETSVAAGNEEPISEIDQLSSRRSTMEERPADFDEQLDAIEEPMPDDAVPARSTQPEPPRIDFDESLPAASDAGQEALDRPTADFLSYTPKPSEEFGDEGGKVEDNRRLYVIIAILVGLLLLCCCVLFLIVVVAYTQQDLLNSILGAEETSMLPAVIERLLI